MKAVTFSFILIIFLSFSFILIERIPQFLLFPFDVFLPFDFLLVFPRMILLKCNSCKLGNVFHFGWDLIEWEELKQKFWHLSIFHSIGHWFLAVDFKIKCNLFLTVKRCIYFNTGRFSYKYLVGLSMPVEFVDDFILKVRFTLRSA